MKEGIKGLRVGIPKEYYGSGIEAEVEHAVLGAARHLEALGAKLTHISLPMTEYAIPTYYLIATAEASSNLARYDGVRYGHRSKRGGTLLSMYERTRKEGFGPEVKRRIVLGAYALSAGYHDAYYLKALKVRTVVREDFERAFRAVDLILTPTSPTAAFKKGEKLLDPLEMYLSDVFTVSASLAGIPAISIPCGLSSQGLPIGLQLLGKALDEETVLRAAYSYESATEWHTKRAPALELDL